MGLKPGAKIAIECGNFEPQKIAQLNLFFDEVMILPFMNNRITGSITAREATRNKVLLEEERSRANRLQGEISEFTESKQRLADAVLVALKEHGASLHNSTYYNGDEEFRQIESRVNEDREQYARKQKISGGWGGDAEKRFTEGLTATIESQVVILEKDIGRPIKDWSQEDLYQALRSIHSRHGSTRWGLELEIYLKTFFEMMKQNSPSDTTPSEG